MAKPEDVTADEFTEHVETGDLPVLVDVWAEWCAPCKLLEPRLEELAEEYDGQVRFLKLNADNNKNLLNQFEIKSIPTMLFFHEGENVDRLVGAVSKKRIRETIDHLL